MSTRHLARYRRALCFQQLDKIPETIKARERVREDPTSPFLARAEPEEVAHGTLSLVLPASSFITGVALPVDGGLTIRNA